MSYPPPNPPEFRDPNRPGRQAASSLIPAGDRRTRSQAVSADHDRNASSVNITVPGSVGVAGKRVIRLGIKLIGWSILIGLIALGWWFGSPERRLTTADVTPDTSSLVPAAIADDFSRDVPATLDGVSSTGIQWSTLGNGFRVEDGVATVNDGDGTNTVALIGTATANGRIEAELAWAPAGTGVIFRYQDLFNYWSLVSVPEYGTWNLALTVDGDVTRNWPAGISPTEPGTTVAVDAQGPEVRVFINGELKLTVLDETFSQATGTGILSRTGSQGTISLFAVTPSP